MATEQTNATPPRPNWDFFTPPTPPSRPAWQSAPSTRNFPRVNAAGFWGDVVTAALGFGLGVLLRGWPRQGEE